MIINRHGSLQLYNSFFLKVDDLYSSISITTKLPNTKPMQNQVTFKLNQTTKYDTIGEDSTAIVLIWYRHFQRYDGLDLGFTERQIPSLSLWCEYTGGDEIVFACWCVSELVNYSGHISTRIIYTKQSLLIFLKEIVFFFNHGLIHQ